MLTHSRRVAAPPSDEAERKRARLKVESIEHRLSTLRAQGPPPDRTNDILSQMDLMSVGKPVQVELRVKSKLSMTPYVSSILRCLIAISFLPPFFLFWECGS